ncbi:MAG: hypothetical protein ACREBR_00910, partial [bacterium]
HSIDQHCSNRHHTEPHTKNELIIEPRRAKSFSMADLPTDNHPVDDNDDAVVVDAPASDSAVLKPRRSKGYLKEEDYIIARAWVSASEDPIADTGQKLVRFTNSMGRKYEIFRVEKVEYEKKGLKKLHVDPTANVELMFLNQRTNSSIYQRFIKNISPAVAKMVGICDQNKMKSGENEELHWARLEKLYQEKENKNFIFRECLDYLRCVTMLLYLECSISMILRNLFCLSLCRLQPKYISYLRRLRPKRIRRMASRRKPRQPS